jgi:hypothetical protein
MKAKATNLSLSDVDRNYLRCLGIELAAKDATVEDPDLWGVSRRRLSVTAAVRYLIEQDRRTRPRNAAGHPKFRAGLGRVRTLDPETGITTLGEGG